MEEKEYTVVGTQSVSIVRKDTMKIKAKSEQEAREKAKEFDVEDYINVEMLFDTEVPREDLQIESIHESVTIDPSQ